MTNPNHFAYYVVRVRVSAPDEPLSVAGVVERLGTGRKQSFQEGQELLRLIADWYVPTKMPPAAETGNESTKNGGGL